jgi:hypothetical protein
MLASGIAAPRGELRGRYLENRYDTPIVNAGLFNQAERDCVEGKITDPSDANW